MNTQEILDYLKRRMDELNRNGQLKLIHHRFCSEQDIVGLKLVIRGNKAISCIRVIPKYGKESFEFLGCDEYFYTTTDEEFNTKGREQLVSGIVEKG